jgi:hypothetical protein
MAVRTDGAKIIDRINDVRTLGAGNQRQVVDMNEAPANFTIGLGKFHITDATSATIVIDTSLAGLSVALIPV